MPLGQTTRRGRFATAAGLALIVTAGVCVRMLPAWRTGVVEWSGDNAFHARLLETQLATGRLPEHDLLALTPSGKPITTQLPVGLYRVAAGFHRWTGGAASDAQARASWFTAIAGALCAAPIFWSARQLGMPRAATLVAAACTVLVPAHLARTSAGGLGGDALGTLLWIAHWGAMTAALIQRRWWTAWLAGAALLWVAALWVWEWPLLWAAFLSAVLLTGFARGRLPRRLLVGIGTLLGAVVVGSAWLPYLARGPSGPFLTTHLGILVWITLATALFEAFTQFRLQKAGWAKLLRLVVVAAAVLLPLAWGTPGAATTTLIDGLAGWRGAVEAGSPEAGFSLLVAAPLWWWAVDRSRPGPAAPASHTLEGRRLVLRLWHAATILLVAASLFTGPRLVAAPFLALYPALLWSAAGTAGPRRPAWPPTFWLGSLAWGGLQLLNPLSTTWRLALLAVTGLAWTHSLRQAPHRAQIACILTATLVGTLAAAGRTTVGRRTVLPPSQRSILEVLARESTAGDVVACGSDHAYVVQTHAGRPTVTDGEHRSRDNQRRLLEWARALGARRPDAFYQLCLRYEARYAWVSSREIPSPDANSERQPDAAGRARAPENVAARLLSRDAALPCCTTVARADGEVLVAIDLDCAGRAVRLH